MDVKQHFGSHLKTLRNALGISQEGLAERAGMHRTYIGSIERGERNVSLINILALAKALKCKPSTLFYCFDDNDY